MICGNVFKTQAIGADWLNHIAASDGYWYDGYYVWALHIFMVFFIIGSSGIIGYWVAYCFLLGFGDAVKSCRGLLGVGSHG